MTIPVPPATIPECGTIQPDGTVNVKLTWTPSPTAESNQDLMGWPLGAEDIFETSIFGACITPNVSSFDVPGLGQGEIYFWKVITDGELESQIAWFKAKTSGVGPPEGGGIPIIVILAAGGLILFLIATKKLSPQAEAAAVAIPFIPP